MAKKSKKPVGSKRSVDYARAPSFSTMPTEFRPVQERPTIEYAEGRSGEFRPIQAKPLGFVDHIRAIPPRDAAYLGAAAVLAIVIAAKLTPSAA